MEKINGLSSVCVRNDDGTINVPATLFEIEDQLLALAVKETESLGAISAAVHAVFDQHVGANLPMPHICSTACGLMGIGPSEFVETQKAVGLWIRTNNEFKVSKGKSGGVVRLRDRLP